MRKHYYGGQAVIEGVMMRGRKTMAVAVRNPQGEIVLHEEPLTARIYTSNWGQWPFIRGVGMLWDALAWACALMWSAEVASQEEGEEKIEFSGPVAWTTLAGSLAFAVALFFLVPTLASRWLASFANDHAVVDAILEGHPLGLVYGLPLGHQPDAGHPPRLRLSRGRAQDDQRL